MRRRALKLLVAVLATVVALGAFAVPAHADSAADQFLAKINALRSSKGLGSLRVDGALTAFAQDWSDHMATANKLSHNPALSSSPGTWTKAGENVGVGHEVDTLFDAFVASPRHYDNLVDPAFNIIGIGVTVLPSGVMYTTHNFEARPAAAPATTVPRRPATTTTAVSRPKPVPTTTSAPRPTPTTTAVRPAQKPPSPKPAPVPAAPSTPVPDVAAAPAPSPPPPPPTPLVPARIALSLEQLRGLDPVL